ncbi:MAG TPA: membrane protein insertase YidC [Spirochaetia bacterium]|nr:membrane protein insertase YidC [Spirochaetales bacterium]HRY79545.1 membrane protein insertase YidC [Spirochaetia bacterium]
MNETRSDKAFDSKTILAIVLSVLVMAGGTWIQQKFWPTQPAPAAPPAATQPAAAQPATAPAAVSPGLPTPGAAAPVLAAAEFEAPSAEATYTVKTDVMEAVFTNRGGELVSLRLPEHADKDGVVELIDAPRGEAQAFALALGGPNAPPLRELMNFRRIDDRTVEFWRTFLPAAGGTDPFTLRKRFTFVPGEYMFRLEIVLENSVNDVLPLTTDGFAYTLGYGPRIGPTIHEGGRYADFRKFAALENGKKKNINPKGGVETTDRRAAWSAVAGKYFTLIVLPDATPYTTTYRNHQENGKTDLSSLAFSRPVVKASRQTDIFHIYFGPKSSRELVRYDDSSKNAFGRTGDKLEEVMEGGNVLGWLEAILKVGLNFFHGLIPNYGIAIILLTILTKVLMYPITAKGSQGTARMQELQPKIQEIQAKYKNNPQKMNQEMAEFYKREGYNPMSGCLPLLIQFPIFIAMYNLFNNHFDLRGASFIAGWISDLSQPEAIFKFAEPINLVIWKMSAIRGLPIIYVASQLLYGKFTQQPQSGGQSASQMKIMMYGMPIMFFFILYDVPSGLLVYWIVSNVLTIGQQAVINRMIHQKKLAAAAAAPAPVIAPVKGRKGKGR